jgi:hypothetical protein
MSKLTLPQAAARLGTTRQNVYKKAKRLGMLKRVDNPYVRGGFHYVLSERDVCKLEKEKK